MLLGKRNMKRHLDTLQMREERPTKAKDMRPLKTDSISCQEQRPPLPLVFLIKVGINCDGKIAILSSCLMSTGKKKAQPKSCIIFYLRP